VADERTERVARNEAVFREVNERIRESTDRLTSPDEADFLCECGNRGCVQMINLSLDEYEAVRSSGRRFAVIPGHEILDLERIVDQTPRYTVVEKLGAGADIAEESDPRARP
jgi:hypothetical protein